jgi:hypothetical protein
MAGRWVGIMAAELSLIGPAPNQDRIKGNSTTRNSHVEHALAYLQQGWSLVMMPSGSKGPTTPGWNAPSELVATPEKALARLAQGPQNMGLVHQPSQTVAIDVDDEAWARHILEQFGIDFDGLMQSGMRIRSKANRDKVIFAGAPDLPLLKVTWPKKDAKGPTDLFTIIEFRAGPNQDVLPPSLHPDGHNYTWWDGKAPWDFETLPQMPQQLLDFWRTLADPNTGLREEIKNLCPWRPAHERKKPIQRARSLTGDHQDVIGKFNQANDVESLLTAGGYKKRGKRYLAPSSSTCIPGVVVLEDKCYSHHGSDPLADGYAHDAFDLHTLLAHGGNRAAALDDAAAQLGIEREAQSIVPDMVCDVQAMIESQERRKAATAAAVEEAMARINAAPVAPGIGELPAVFANRQSLKAPVMTEVIEEIGYPPSLVKPPGMVGEITEWILQTSQLPQRILAVAGALALVAVVLGRVVASPSGARPNLNLVGVAETGYGKDHARSCIKRALFAAGLDALLGGEEIASAQGLMSRMAAAPVSIYLLDEFGVTLSAMKNRNAGNHERLIGAAFMKLHSSANTFMTGTDRADTKLNPRKDVRFPHCVLYGTTTPRTFYDALDGADVASGFLNRLMVVEAPSTPPIWQEAALWGVPEKLVAWLQSARQIRKPGQLELTGEYPLVLPYGGMGKEMFDGWRDWVQNHQVELRKDPHRAPLADLWARAYEHAL